MTMTVQKIRRAGTVLLHMACLATPALSRPAAETGITISQFYPSEFPKFQIYVSVVDASGRSRPGLAAGDFVVFEDGVRIPIEEAISAFDLRDEAFSSLTVALVIDNSNSMQGYMPAVVDAANLFIDRLRDYDRVSILLFSEDAKKPNHVWIRTPMTNSTNVLLKKISDASLTRSTYLYNALWQALKNLAAEETLGRKAVIVLSDGDDTGSKIDLQDCGLLARRCDIPVFAIRYKTGSDGFDMFRLADGRTIGPIEKIALSTGGRFFPSSDSKTITDLYESILSQLQGQYRLGVATSAESWVKPSRTIRVEIPGAGFAERTFESDPARMAYIRLLYHEKMIRTKSNDYLDYLAEFPKSEWSDDVRFKLGVFYEERGSFKKAMDLYAELDSLPDSEWRDEVLFRKGRIYEQLGEDENARDQYADLAGRYPGAPDAPEALLRLARVHQRMSQPGLAEASYRKIGERYPESDVSDDALLELGYLFQRQAMPDSAERAWRGLVRQYPQSNSSSFAYYELGGLCQHKDSLEQALQFCDLALGCTADTTALSKASCRKGEILFEMGNWDAAIAAYDQVLDRFAAAAEEDRAHLGLAKAFREKGDYRAMRRHFDRWEMLHPIGTDTTIDLHRVNRGEGTIAPLKGGRIASLSGAYLEVPPETVSFPLQVTVTSIPTPETQRNLSIAGKIYNVTAAVDTFFKPIRLALPYDPKWMEDPAKSRDGFRLYSYERDAWREIPGSRIDSTDHVISAEVRHLSLKTIMYQKPMVLRFSDVLFEFGSYYLSGNSFGRLDSIALMLKNKPEYRLEVAGHTDGIGGDAANNTLSQRRADAIRDVLIQLGVATDRIIAKGYGKRFPISENETDEGRATNRRTEFTVISKGEKDITDESLRKRTEPRFAIELGPFALLPQAYEERYFYRKRGIAFELIEREQDGKTIFLLWEGSYPSAGLAEERARKIGEEFKQLNFRIVER
jgi:VWFA-related protein